MKKTIVLSFIICLVLMGCGAVQKPQIKQQTAPEKPAIVDQQLAGQAKQIASKVRGVEDSTAVVINKEISVAIKVNGFDRLRLRTIRQEVFQKIKSIHNDYTLNITSDKKLFKQLQSLEQKIKQDQITSSTDLQKKVNKINQDMRG